MQPLLTLAGTFLAQSLTRQPGAGGPEMASAGARGAAGGRMHLPLALWVVDLPQSVREAVRRACIVMVNSNR